MRGRRYRSVTDDKRRGMLAAGDDLVTPW